MRDTIDMAREAGYMKTIQGGAEISMASMDCLKAFEALVRADERKSRSHSLGPGEMELSLRREHKGELFEYRYRFTQEQVLHGPHHLVEGTAGILDAAITHAIRARGEAK